MTVLLIEILILINFRKHGPGAGETIQSYTHHKRKEDSLEKSYQSSIAGDDDNIDVVNDDDKGSGKHSCRHFKNIVPLNGTQYLVIRVKNSNIPRCLGCEHNCIASS